MKIPGPDHPITIEKNPKRVVVKVNGETVADTTNAKILREANYPPVNYIPRTDVDLMKLARTTHTTECPFKGDASYFSLKEHVEGENAVWSYETPHPAVADIKEHLAFYPNKVTIEESD
jgi:uncharacterized protein (DUF427 family)